MNKKFHLNNDQSISDITSVMVSVLALDDKKPHIVHIKPNIETTSDRQRKYYFKIIGEIAKFTGETNDDQHWHYKEMFLVPIFKRRVEYSKLLHSANKLYEYGNMDEFTTLRRFIITKTSITEAKVKEMAEYITLVIQHGEMELGLTLPRPEDLKLLKYKEAQI